MKNINKINQNCHPELVSGSMVGSAWKVEDNLNGLCQRTNGFRTKSGMTGECGRSMVEMLGVLAIIGVLSVGGIAGYTMAMNKHKANEILNGASVRGMTVMTQLAQGRENLSIDEFATDKPAGAEFATPTLSEDKTTFSFVVSNVDKNVCAQMKNIVGSASLIQEITCDETNSKATITFKNEMGGSGNTSDNCFLNDSCSATNHAEDEEYIECFDAVYAKNLIKLGGITYGELPSCEYPDDAKSYLESYADCRKEGYSVKVCSLANFFTGMLGNTNFVNCLDNFDFACCQDEYMSGNGNFDCCDSSKNVDPSLCYSSPW